jgi:hypothetical protein
MRAYSIRVSKRGISPSFFSSPLSKNGEGDEGDEVDKQF